MDPDEDDIPAKPVRGSGRGRARGRGRGRGAKGAAQNKAKMEDYNKMPLKKDKGGLGFTFVGGKDTHLVRKILQNILEIQRKALELDQWQ